MLAGRVTRSIFIRYGVFGVVERVGGFRDFFVSGNMVMVNFCFILYDLFSSFGVLFLRGWF